MWVLWYLWLSTFFVATRTGKLSCSCGYGGSCLRSSETGEPFLFPCKLCDEFSRGYYNSCTTITDHCQSSPCARGRCVPTFGAYYCDCPKDYFGKNCDIFSPFYSSVGISNEVNAYHQFQPNSEGISWFHLIYDPKSENLWKEYGIEVRVNVTAGDGRRYFPLRDEHFVEKDIKEMCLQESSSQYEAHDPRICDLLPEGRKWTYTVETTLYAFAHEAYREFTLPGLGSLADFSVLTVQVQVIRNGTRNILYEHSYPVFSYDSNSHFESRIPYRCKLEMDFRDCSTDKRYPWLNTPGQGIFVKAVHRYLSCEGVTYLGSTWHMQRNIDRIERVVYDPVPNPLQEYRNQVNITFPRRFFTAGLHMMQYGYRLRGEPPIRGATKEFTIVGACWFEVVRAHPNLGFNEGNRRYASCYRPFKLETVSFDTNYSPLEFQFYAWCDDPDYKECEYRRQSGPSLTLYETPCGKKLQISMKAEHLQELTAPVLLNVEVTFVRSEVDLFIECLRNCNPINPEFRTTILAKTESYSPGSVSWNIEVDGVALKNTPLVSYGGDVNSLLGTSSRVVRLRGDSFKSTSQSTAKVTYNVSKGDRGFSEYKTEAVNLEYYIDAYKLIDLSDGRYKFERQQANNSNGTFFPGMLYPMNFYVYSVDTDLEEAYIEVDTFHERFLTFTPHYDEVQLCLRGPVHAMYAEGCTPFLEVKANEYSRINMEEIQALFEARDTRKVLSGIAIYLSSDLRKTDPRTLQWTISLDERKTIVTISRKVDVYMQADYLFALSIINAFLYTEEGCKDQGFMRTFIDERKSKLDFDTGARLLSLRFWATSALQRVMGYLSVGIDMYLFKLRIYPFGPLFRLYLRSMALAHFRDLVKEEESDFAARNIRKDYVLAEQEYWSNKIKEKLYETLVTFSVAMGKLSLSFDGLRHIGRGSTHAWSTRTTYNGILTFLNKSREPLEVGSKFYTNNFFGTTEQKLEEIWVTLCELQFPPLPVEWQSEIFSMTVVAMKPQLGQYRVRAPVISVDLRRQVGKRLRTLHKLPNNLTYTVSLPTVRRGKVSNDTVEFFALSEVVVPGDLDPGVDPRRNYVVYKVSFQAPLLTAGWHFIIAYDWWFVQFTSPEMTEFPAHLKVKIFYDHPPEYEDVEAGEWYNFTVAPFDSDYMAIFVPVVSPSGESFIPSTFYVGIIPPPNTSTVMLDTLDIITVCSVLEPNERKSHVCEHKALLDNLMNIQCECEYFGVIETKTNDVRLTRFTASNIEITVSTEGRMLPSILTCAFLFAFACSMIIYAFAMERRRRRNVLQYVGDSHPVDKHLLLVGVQTGMNPLAGTSSKVAIKINGVESSSRVHILESQSRRSLLPGNDDWFLIPTSNPLGKISSVTIWLNYHLLSDWYCSHIWIRDFTTTKWYLVNVGQWMRISPADETPQKYHFAAEEVDDETLDKNHPEDKFSTYYFKELRNRHLPLSAFYLHNRCVKTLPQRAVMYILRVFSIHVLVWVMLNHVAHLLFSKGDLDPEALTSVTLNTTLMIFLITATSRLFSSIPELVYKTSTIPRMLQRRMTHQMFFATESKTRLFKSADKSRTTRSESKVSSRTRYQRKKSRSRSRGISIVSSIRPRSATLQYEQNWNNRPWFHRTGLRAILSLLFGPTQYRSVNVSQELLQRRSVKTLWFFRAITAILILSMYSFIVYIAFFTHYWQTFAESAFLFHLSLLFDAIIFEPALIFIRSFLAFVFFQMSNAERNWWVEDTKYLTWPTRPKMDFKAYFEKVTRPEYNPLSSTELENKRRKKFRWDLVKTLAFHSLMVLTIAAGCTILTKTTPPVLYDVYRLMRASFDEPNSDFGHRGIPIKDVIDRKSASTYLAETMADADIVWPNEKYVRNLSSTYSNTTGKVVYTGPRIAELIIPEEFGEFFEHSYQYLSGAEQHTQPIVFFDDIFPFDASGRGFFVGATRERYPMGGHVLYIQLDPWQQYFIKLRHTLDLILFTDTLIPRAGIFTTNYFCPYTPSITTVDFIIEVLPSGVCSARLEIESAVVYTPHYWTARYSWILLSVVAVLLGILNVYLICEVGLYLFVESFQFRIRQWFWLSCFIYAGFGAATRLEKYRVLRDISQRLDMDNYSEFHGIHQNEMFDNLICAFVVFVGVVELAIMIHRFLGTDRFKLAFFSVARLTGGLVLILMYLCAVYQSAHVDIGNQPMVLLFYIALKEIYPLSPENLPYNRFSFILVLTVAIAMKCSAGFAIYRYLQVKKDKLDIRNAIINEHHVWRIRDLNRASNQNTNSKPATIVVIEDRGSRSPDSHRSKSKESPHGSVPQEERSFFQTILHHRS